MMRSMGQNYWDEDRGDECSAQVSHEIARVVGNAIGEVDDDKGTIIKLGVVGF